MKIPARTFTRSGGVTSLHHEPLLEKEEEEWVKQRCVNLEVRFGYELRRMHEQALPYLDNAMKDCVFIVILKAQLDEIAHGARRLLAPQLNVDRAKRRRQDDLAASWPKVSQRGNEA